MPLKTKKAQTPTPKYTCTPIELVGLEALDGDGAGETKWDEGNRWGSKALVGGWDGGSIEGG